MNIDKHLDVINACRFCFMCRHLATLGNVTFKESDTPRGRALVLDKVRMNKENLKNPDYINSIYEATLSAACRFHCVSNYDEAGLLLAARKDIVESGLAPEKAKALAEELQNVEFKVEGNGKTLYYKSIYSEDSTAYSDCKIISGGDSGKALEVLGFTEKSKAVFTKFKATVESSGCKTLVTSCPASYDMFKEKLEGIEVLHSSEYLYELAHSDDSGKAYYLDSDFLKNYNDNMPAPRKLLEKCGYELLPFGTNREESYSVGEGAVVYDKLNPELTQKLCERILDLADDPEKDILITASPYAKSALNKYCPELTVLSLEEAALGKTGE
jgi:Fe-S oxidoreductase